MRVITIVFCTSRQPHDGGAHSAPSTSGAGRRGPRERGAGVRGGAPV